MKNSISEFLQSRIEAKDFPSAVYLVAEKGEIVFQEAMGDAVVDPRKLLNTAYVPEILPATLETIYDLASLTKVLVTGLLCAKAIETGEMVLSDRIEKFLPDYDGEDKREITIENLLTHTSGFPAWLPFYLFYDLQDLEGSFNYNTNFEARRNLVRQKISETPLENAINSKVVYSDLNFITLGFILEKIYSQDLKSLAQTSIFHRLKLTDTRFQTPRQPVMIDPDWRRYAASEKGNFYEKQTCAEMGYDVSKSYWRDRLIWGEVHDGNCWFMGGVSGHAGLFSTAYDVYKIARQFLENQSILLKPETCRLFRTNLTSGLNEARSIAFQLAATPESTASNSLSKNSFGHLGFAGTSLWIEPETERVFILLTNRTHAHELPFVNINSVRRKFHELATEALNEF